MDFFRAQEHARKQTRWLILLFLLAVFCLVIVTTLCVALFIWFNGLVFFGETPAGVWPALKHFVLTIGLEKFAWIAGIIGGSVGLATLFRWLDLRKGGFVIAEAVGGRLIASNTRDSGQRRLLNVVEEMALASGMPVPPVYLLADERGINAFAAGQNFEDAVIGVTQGCLDALNREQLQGVIAHEFSHILNGDMRMNQNLVAILAGLMMISTIGRWIINLGYGGLSRNRSLVNMGVMLLGVAMMALGWLGYFLGALIRAAVSRQREFLADASAVQFTRNPQGIGGALQVIGGYIEHSNLTHHRAHELGHFFFGAASESKLLDVMGTHPPLHERIRRVLPGWRGNYLHADPQMSTERADQGEGMRSDNRMGFVQEGGVTHSVAPMHSPNQAPSCSRELSVRDMNFAWLRRQSREPASAQLMVLGLLLHQGAELRAQAAEHLPELTEQEADVLDALLQIIKTLEPDDHLPLLELCMPTLKLLSTAQYMRMREWMCRIINEDRQVELFEWAVFEIVRQYCDSHFGLRGQTVKHYKSMSSLEPHFRNVLMKLVQLGSNHPEARRKAFAEGCKLAGLAESTPFSNEPCSAAKFTHASRELAKAAPIVKPKLLNALIHAAKSDGSIKSQERQLIAAISVMMDCPLVGLS